MKRLLVIAATTIGAIGIGSAVSTQSVGACPVDDYQGAPIEVCPPPEPEPDPTNCYTGWYQGAPIEICKPTGESLPPGTIDMRTGEPTVIHVSKDYVAPAAPAPEIAVTPAPVAPPIAVSWLDELQAILVGSGGW